MISVIVCTYNRAGALRQMLDSFFAQTCLKAVPHEVIVVDNNSTDETKAVVDAHGDRPELRYLPETRQGLSFARNAGVAAARGEIVAFLDDDVLLSPEWLARLQACFDETAADVVGGRSFLKLPGPAPPWLGHQFRLYLSEVDLGDRRCDAGNGSRLFGLNVAFRRSAVRYYGGFDEGLGRTGADLLSGEERHLMEQIHAAGGKLMYDPDASVEHLIEPERLEWAYFTRLSEGTARSLALADARRPKAYQRRRLVQTAVKLAVYSLALPFVRLAGRDRYAYRSLYCRWLRMRTLLPLQRQALRDVKRGP